MIEELISNDHDMSETFNKILANIIPNLKIIPNDNFETANEYEIKSTVENATKKFENYPSIKMILSRIKPNKRFCFCPVLYNEIQNKLKI